MPEIAYNVIWDIWIRYWNDGHINQQRHHKLKSGQVVVEAGAYIGYYSLKMAQDVGASGRIIAVEPVEENREIILKNITANGIENITVLPYAIWNQPGTTVFYLTDRQKNSLLRSITHGRGTVRQIVVPTNTIDNIIREQNIPSPNLVIITVNGVEVQALLGMEQTLKNPDLHLVIAAKYVVDGQPTWEQVESILTEKGFKVILDREGFTKNEKPEQQAVVYACR